MLKLFTAGTRQQKRPLIRHLLFITSFVNWHCICHFPLVGHNAVFEYAGIYNLRNFEHHSAYLFSKILEIVSGPHDVFVFRFESG